MISLDCGTYFKLIPETKEEHKQLKKRFPELWPFESVCIAYPPKQIGIGTWIKYWSNNSD